MFKVLDVFPIGKMLSVTLEGECKEITNGIKLVDSAGNTIIVDSVAMTRHTNPEDINLNTTIFVEANSIERGSEWSIA